MRSFRYFGLLFLLIASSVDAAIRYADPAGSGTTCSTESPCSLNEALSQAVAGDTLKLKTGTYSQPAKGSDLEGSSGNLIIVEPDTDADVIIDGGWCDCTSTYVHFRAPAGTTFKMDPNYGTCSIGLAFLVNSIVENLEITRAGSHGIFGLQSSQLLNLHVHHNGGTACFDEPPHHQHGVYTGGGAHDINNLIDGGSYHDNTGQGIQCYSTCANTTIRNIKVYNNGSWGVLILGGSANKIYNVVFYRNDLTRDGGSVCLCSPNVEAYNLTVYETAGVGIYVDGKGIIIRNSISLGNSGANYSVASGSATTSNNIFSGTASEHFVDVSTYDLQLQLGSAARDAGTSISGTFAADLRGITRPQGVAWDIGAYEFIAAQTPAAPSGLTINVQ